MRHPAKILGLVAVLAAAPTLEGCVAALFAGGAATATAASQERGLGGAISDTAIRAEINKLWLEQDADMFLKVGLTVSEGRVLLTGNVQTPQARVDAVRLAWKPKGVKEVINEIKIADSEDFGTYARDSRITAELRSRLMFDGDVQSYNYSIDTVKGTIYLMGIAQSETELDRVKNQARDVPYVKRVVSYVILKDDPRRESS